MSDVKSGFSGYIRVPPPSSENTPQAACPTCGSYSKKQRFCEMRHVDGLLNLPHTAQSQRCRACTDSWHDGAGAPVPSARQDDPEYPFVQQNTFDADDPAPDGQMYDRHGNPVPAGARDEILYLRESLERTRQELAAAKERAEQLQQALRKIADNYGGCRCDHSDDSCCENPSVGEFCPHCISEIALRERVKELESKQCETT